MLLYKQPLGPWPRDPKMKFIGVRGLTPDIRDEWMLTVRETGDDTDEPGNRNRGVLVLCAHQVQQLHPCRGEEGVHGCVEGGEQ